MRRPTRLVALATGILLGVGGLIAPAQAATADQSAVAALAADYVSTALALSPPETATLLTALQTIFEDTTLTEEQQGVQVDALLETTFPELPGFFSADPREVVDGDSYYYFALIWNLLLSGFEIDPGTLPTTCATASAVHVTGTEATIFGYGALGACALLANPWASVDDKESFMLAKTDAFTSVIHAVSTADGWKIDPVASLHDIIGMMPEMNRTAAIGTVKAVSITSNAYLTAPGSALISGTVKAGTRVTAYQSYGAYTYVRVSSLATAVQGFVATSHLVAADVPFKATGWVKRAVTVRTGHAASPVTVSVNFASTALLQKRKSGATTWVTVKSIGSRLGKVAVTFPLEARTGTYAYRLVVQANAFHTGYISPAQSVTVTR